MGDDGAPLARRSSYVLTRFLILRLLGLVYCVAFLIVIEQFEPLLGSGGLLPVAPYLAAVQHSAQSRADAFLSLPTLFWLACSDRTMLVTAWIGFGLSL